MGGRGWRLRGVSAPGGASGVCRLQQGGKAGPRAWRCLMPLIKYCWNVEALLASILRPLSQQPCMLQNSASVSPRSADAGRPSALTPGHLLRLLRLLALA